MSVQSEAEELRELGHMKSYEPRIEALQKREDKDRDDLVRLGKTPVLKVRSHT